MYRNLSGPAVKGTFALFARLFAVRGTRTVVPVPALVVTPAPAAPSTAATAATTTAPTTAPASATARVPVLGKGERALGCCGSALELERAFLFL